MYKQSQPSSLLELILAIEGLRASISFFEILSSDRVRPGGGGRVFVLFDFWGSRRAPHPAAPPPVSPPLGTPVIFRVGGKARYSFFPLSLVLGLEGIGHEEADRVSERLGENGGGRGGLLLVFGTFWGVQLAPRAHHVEDEGRGGVGLDRPWVVMELRVAVASVLERSMHIQVRGGSAFHSCAQLWQRKVQWRVLHLFRQRRENAEETGGCGRKRGVCRKELGVGRLQALEQGVDDFLAVDGR